MSTIMKDKQTQMRYPLSSDMTNGVRSDDITYWWCAHANVQQTEFSLHRPPPSIDSRVKDPAGWYLGFSLATPWTPDVLTYFTQWHQTYGTVLCMINRIVGMSILYVSDNGITWDYFSSWTLSIIMNLKNISYTGPVPTLRSKDGREPTDLDQTEKAIQSLRLHTIVALLCILWTSPLFEHVLCSWIHSYGSNQYRQVFCKLRWSALTPFWWQCSKRNCISDSIFMVKWIIVLRPLMWLKNWYNLSRPYGQTTK